MRGGNLSSRWRQQFKKNIQLFTLPNQKLKIQFSVSLYRISQSNLSVFLSGKEFSIGFDDCHSDVLLFFVFICTREVLEKEARVNENVVQWESLLL